MPIHDATNNFKLYRRHFLNLVTIERRDRTAGTSRFNLRAWLPKYLRWYLHLFGGRLRRSRPSR